MTNPKNLRIVYAGTPEFALPPLELLIEYDPQPPFNCGHMSKAAPDIQKQASKEMRQRAVNRRDFISVPKMVWQQWRSRMS